MDRQQPTDKEQIDDDGEFVLVDDYQSGEYRGFLLVQHVEHGLLLLHCTRKKNKGPHWQLPGGRIDETEFRVAAGTVQGDRDGQLLLAGKMGAARELWEETGIDLRSQLDRIAPAVLRVSTKSSPSDPSGILDNELNHKLFFLVTVTDQDFEDLSETGVQAMGTELTDCMYKDIKITLSVEHSGFAFQSNVITAAKMLVLHSGGKATKALGLAWSYDPTKFVDSVRAATDTTVDTAT